MQLSETDGHAVQIISQHTPIPITGKIHCMSKVIAIDGPAASGKSTVAKLLARRLGFTYVDTGAMYRAVTWAVIEAGEDPKDEDSVKKVLGEVNMECGVDDSRSVVMVDGVNPGMALKSDSVNAGVSYVAKVPEVRRYLIDLQRRFADREDIVMEGRDIGSVVFPDTPYKFYIDASEEVRAQRRSKEGLDDSIKERDRIDSTRAESPLVISDDAKVVDSSDLTIDGVTDEILGNLAGSGITPVE